MAPKPAPTPTSPIGIALALLASTGHKRSALHLCLARISDAYASADYDLMISYAEAAKYMDLNSW